MLYYPNKYQMIYLTCTNILKILTKPFICNEEFNGDISV